MKNEMSEHKEQFEEFIKIIETARERAYKAVNTELINMYWEIGEYVSCKAKNEEWGKAVVKEFSRFIRENYPDLKGFSPQNIWRMK